MNTKMRGTLATTLPVGPESVDRLRRGIAEAGLGCGCREAADDMHFAGNGATAAIRAAGQGNA